MIVSNLANSLLLIIDDILDISKIEAGRMTVESIPFSARSAVFGILKTLAVKATQSRLDLMYSVESDIPDLLVGDPFRLRQVITNLVGNAIKVSDILPCIRKPSILTACLVLHSLPNEVKSPFLADYKLPTSKKRRINSSSVSAIPESESNPTSSTSSSILSLKQTGQQRENTEELVSV